MRQTVQMASVLVDQLRNEWWSAARHETKILVQRCQRREQRIDDPQTVIAPTQIMPMDAACVMDTSRHEAAVVEILIRLRLMSWDQEVHDLFER